MSDPAVASVARLLRGGPRAALLIGILLGVPWSVDTVRAGAPAGQAGGAGPADPTARPHVISVRDSPGYYAPSDPESMSVVLGRRLQAPLVSKRFTGGAGSLDDLGRTVCRALHRGAADTLLSLCISDDEFQGILWREFPQSRPAVGLTWEDAWRILDARLHAGTRHAVRDYGGHLYQFLRFERADSTARYRNFKLHNGLILVVRDDEGQIQKWNWLRSVAERRGVFKIYTTSD